MPAHAPQQNEAPAAAQAALLLLSAPDRDGLLRRVDELLALPASAALPAVNDAPQAARLAIIAPRQAWRDRLASARGRIAGLARPRLTLRASGIYLGLEPAAPTARRIAFLFPGQGSQHPGMLQELHRRTPVVRGWLDALDAAYVRAGRPRPTALIYGAAADNPAISTGLFSMEQGAQLCTAANLALYELMGQLGLHADALVGHSIGEHAAVLAAHAGNGDHRTAICTELCRLGLASIGLEEPAAPEGMAAVSAIAREQLEAIVARHPQQLFIAMDNCPNQQVIAGTRAALAEAIPAIVAAGGISALLPFVRAYHTPLFGARVGKLAAWYRQLQLTPAPLRGQAPPVYSCLTGEPIPAAPDAAAQVMAQQWTAPVNFHATIARLYAAGIDTFVEVGPDAKLTAFVEDILRGQPHLAVSMVGPAASGQTATLRDLAQIGHMLAALYAHGVAVSAPHYAALVNGHISVEVSRSAAPAGQQPAAAHPGLAIHRDLIAAANAQLAALAARLEPPTPAPGAARPAAGWPLAPAQMTVNGPRLTATRRFTLATDPCLADHSLGRTGAGALPVLSFTTSLALAAAAGEQLLAAAGPLQITDIQARQWLAFDEGELAVRVVGERRGGAALVEVVEEGRGAGGAARGAAFAATVEEGRAAAAPLLAADGAARAPVRWSAARFYADYAFHGPSFQGLAQVTSVGAQSAEAVVRVTELPGVDRGTLHLDPALVDCAGQLVAFWLLEQGGRAPTFGIFPVSARRYFQPRPAPPPGAELRCRCRVTLAAGGLTTADVVFFTGDALRRTDQVVAVLEGFVQRLIEFPPALAACLFGGAAVAFSQPRPAPPGQAARQIDTADWTILQGGQGVWARLMAQQMLTPGERRAWRSVALAAQLTWLLGRVALKETAAAWAATRGAGLPLAAITLEAQPDGKTFIARSPALPQPLDLHLATAGTRLAVSYNGLDRQ